MNWKNIIKKSWSSYLECHPTPIAVNGIIDVDGNCGNAWLIIKNKKHSLVLEGLKKNYLIISDGEIHSNFLLKTQSYEKIYAFHLEMKKILEKQGLKIEIVSFLD